MAKVVSIEDHNLKKAAERGFREWARLIPSTRLDEKTRWRDLPDYFVFYLSEDTAEGRLTIYDLIMGVRGLGSGWEFEALPGETLMALLDDYFFLVDQVRFETLRRIGWLEEIPYGERPIIEQALGAQRLRYSALVEPLAATNRHPAYEAILESSAMEIAREVRSCIPQAIEVFRREIEIRRRIMGRS